MATSSFASKAYARTIVAVSVLVPIVVAVLASLKEGLVDPGFSRGVLPAVNATINGSVAVVLMVGFWAIRTRRIRLHRSLMLSAFVLSALFLVTYVFQHLAFSSAKYGGDLRSVYLPLLASHIILAAIILPMALFTMLRALQTRYDKHRRLARWTLPLWLYVAVTGVAVYLFMAPYY